MKSKFLPWQSFMSLNEKIFSQGGALYLMVIVIPLGDTQSDPIQHSTTVLHTSKIEYHQYHWIPLNTIEDHWIPLIPLDTINTIQYHHIPSNALEYHWMQLNTIQYDPLPSNTTYSSIHTTVLHPSKMAFFHKRSSLLGLWGRGKGVKKGRYFARPLSPAFVLM